MNHTALGSKGTTMVLEVSAAERDVIVPAKATFLRNSFLYVLLFVTRVSNPGGEHFLTRQEIFNGVFFQLIV